ncbi:MAG: hypothetical protein D6730_24265 [Bacteroidetes bacterium]|nr:MAG: hypothetical protein D6730_24265 [Bacteroidota bacterium]
MKKTSFLSMMLLLWLLPQPGFGQCTEAEADTLLPAALLSFEAYAMPGQGVSLEWGTAWELQLKGFAIECRSAEDGSWQQIGFKPGQGHSSRAVYYAFADTQAPAGVAAYRLILTDQAGRRFYTHQLGVETGGKAAN